MRTLWLILCSWLVLASAAAGQGKAYAKFNAKGSTVGLYNLLAEANGCEEGCVISGTITKISSDVGESSCGYTFTIDVSGKSRQISVRMGNGEILRPDVEDIEKPSRILLQPSDKLVCLDWIITTRSARPALMRGINKHGDIVGGCTDNASNFYGYVLTADGFSPVQAPGHLSTVPQGISPDGRIVGCIHDTNTTTTMFGFSLDSGGFNFFGGKFGGLDGTGFMNNGVTKGGRMVVGWFTDTSVSPSRARAYIVRRGVAMAFDYPNAAFTQAWDVNAGGDVVGVYRDADGRIHGFLRSADAEFASIDFPGATLTRAFGINTNGDIVGTYVVSGVQHAFVRSAKGGGNQ